MQLDGQEIDSFVTFSVQVLEYDLITSYLILTRLQDEYTATPPALIMPKTPAFTLASVEFCLYFIL